ncbi:hypothetical protein HG530_012404 [Fusarium avenaceum]|nr:hypothetical protein HG530_012404 [Fusarium avenaceum]
MVFQPRAHPIPEIYIIAIAPLAAGEEEGVESDGTGSGPLRKDLDHAGEVQAVEVAGVEEELLASSEERGVDALKLVLVGGLDGGDFADDVVGLGVLLSQAGHGSDCLFGLALLDEETGRFVDEEAKGKDQTSKHDMNTVYSPEAASVGHEDNNSDDPNYAQLSGSPDTTYLITDEESTTKYIGLDVGLLNKRVVLEVDVFLKVLGLEGARDETLVNSTGSAHETKGKHGEP